MRELSSFAVDSIRRDLAHAFRALRRDRGFAVVCIVSLGIGMGALIALLTFARAITAPARGIDPNGLAEVLVLPEGPLRAKAGEWALEQCSYPDYRVLRETNTGMAITGWAMDSSEVGVKTADAESVPRVETLYVTPNYFSTFGVNPARGVGFDLVEDDAPTGEAKVIISDDFWRSRMAADPDIVGKPLTVGGIPHTVVGVTPADFRGHFHFFQAPASLLFIPLERHPRLKATPSLRDDRTVDWVRIHGRLHPGVTIAQANALVRTTVANLARQYPASNEFKSATVEPYASMGAAGRPESTQVLSIMLGLAASILLVVCLNISGMMLVRGTIRERELCIRAALGADRRRLVQNLFFEALWLAVIGAAVSSFVLFGIPAVAAWYLGVPVPAEVDLDLTGVALASGLCLVVSLLFGLLPALRFSRPNLNTAMKEDPGLGGRQTIRVHRIAAMVQVGIAVPFLVISGVMLDRARTAEFGFDTEGLAAARLPVATGPEQEADFSIRRVRDNVRQASGVRSVAIAEGMPIDFDYREFRVANAAAGQFVTAHVTHVGENFLEAIGAPLLRGRAITLEDRISAAPVAVLSEPLAELLFPATDAIGHEVSVTLDDSVERKVTVIGVTRDFATSQLTTLRPQILLPLPERFNKTVTLIARGDAGAAPQLRAALESALRELGVEPLPGVAFPGIVTGQDMVEKSVQDLISESTAVGVAGGLVLVLAALGIVGVIGFMVATRTRELAVRMALGSSRLRVFRLMLTDVVKLVVPGVAGGLSIAAILIRTMESVLGTPLTLGPDPLGMMEPVIYLGASTIAIIAALLAGLPAARRATTVQPMVAIRSE
ncbi:MAG TPA: ABC transporter permease [Vicinamibacterales bacterium]|nr:ABC transporter permease [Vicinamibacterales bacterium]